MLKEKAGAENNPGMLSGAGSQGEFSVLRLFQGLGICIAVFLTAVHVYKKYVLKDKRPAERSLRILERAALSNKSQLCIVQYNDKRLLLAVGSEKVTFFQENEILDSLSSYADITEASLAVPKAEKELCNQKVN